MNSKTHWIYFCLLFVCCVFMAFGRFQEKPEQTEPKKRNTKSFIRMDLLSVEEKPMIPPGRNIFTQQSAANFGDLSPEEIERKIEEAMSTPDSTSQGKNSNTSFDLRYLGYVLSRQKIVGLVVFRGEALAVVEGDLIAEGFTVSRINTDEIEVLGPDQEPMMFSIEGEFP